MGRQLRQVYYILQKDLKTEVKTLDNFLSSVVFGIMLVFIFTFAFQLSEVQINQAFAAVLWVSIFFCAIIGLQRSMYREMENGAMDALYLATGDQGTIFLAKMLGNLITLLVFEAVIVPVLWIFSGIYGVGMNWWLFLITLFLGTWGLAAIGTMLTGITVQLPTARLLFPILIFPLLIPLLIAVIQCTNSALLNSSNAHSWLYLLLAYDVLFTVLPYVLFDYILEG